MKIYVSVDMEGIAGVVLREQLLRGEPLYQEARHLLTQEVNVIVEGLIEAGASEIIVKDAHGSGFNFIVGNLHPGASYCLGATKVVQRFPGLDSTYDGALLIGYHAMGGTSYAIRDHTMTSTGWQYLTINGKAIGEIGIDSLLFGYHDVPVLMVTGDDKTCAEARRELGQEVVTYQTKIGLNRHAGLIKAPQLVYQEIKGKIREALQSKVRVKLNNLPGPYELVIRFNSTDQADVRYVDGVNDQRLDGLQVVYRDKDLIRLLSRAL